VRALKGLEDAISMDVLGPARGEEGWTFTPKMDDYTPDTVNGADYLHEIYAKADPEYDGRASVPVLRDAERETTVNNGSREILRMLDTAFDKYATREIDLFPEGYRAEIDRVIDEIYEPVNIGVARVGFAETQAAYDEAVADLFDALDYWEGVLAEQRYLAGDELSEADLCMFLTLVRFDVAYNVHFRCSIRRIVDYPNLWSYLKELYGLSGVAETVNVDHIKHLYHQPVPTGIVASGPDIDFTESHDRDRLTGTPPAGASE
jgi:putative glutathione S-transferase